MDLKLIQSQDHSIIKRNDTGVILHLYYPDMWSDLLPTLLNLGKQFDLFVTIPYEVDFSEDIIKGDFPNAQIYRCENRGRDVAPFLGVFSIIGKLGYKYVCKLHTKKSPHISTGIEWQQDMLGKLLGSRKLISQIKKAFDQHPDWGLIAPQGHVAPFNYFWKPNIANVIKLAHSIGIPTDNIGFSFVAGSMFWFRPEAFDLLLKANISTSDFEIEQGQQDGTLAHAFERFFGMVANYAGYKIAESDEQVIKLTDIPFQFRLLIESSQNQEEILTTEIANRGQFIADLSGQLAEKQRRVEILAGQLEEKERVLQGIYSSRTWRLILLIRKVRTAIIPNGTRRERWMFAGLHAVSYLRHHGLRFFARRIMEKLRHEGPPAIANPQPNSFSIMVQDGKLCPIPEISIVIEKNPGLNLPSIEDEEVLAWASAQTLGGIEIAVWRSDTGTAATVGEAARTWDAPGLEDLCGGLLGRYVCMASPDLLQRNPTYLETNLIALETEALAFTVNTLGKPDWLLDSLKSNRLPGDRVRPYLRQVIRKDCVRNDFSLNPTSCLEERPDLPAVAGKIITHTTAFPDADNPFPAATLLAETVEYSLKGNNILVRSNSQVPWEPMAHVVYPVNTVIPVRLESCNLPTIIVFMPFLAVGGAERLALQLIGHLKNQVRFIVVTVEGMDAALGTTADAFHQMIPFAFTAADYLATPLNFSFLSYLIERFQADTFYIANGANLIYDALGRLRLQYPGLRIVDQVYDHQVGWINRYDQTVTASIDAYISANPNITQAYIKHGVRPERIHFVEHAINMDDVNPADYPVERCIQIKQKLGAAGREKARYFLCAHASSKAASGLHRIGTPVHWRRRCSFPYGGRRPLVVSG